MRSNTRPMIGVVTVLLLCFMGLPMLASRPLFGGVLLGLAVYRAYYVRLEFRARRASRLQEPEERKP